MNEPRIFLCHASDDIARVRELYHRLKGANLSPQPTIRRARPSVGLLSVYGGQLGVAPDHIQRRMTRRYLQREDVPTVPQELNGV